MSKVLRLDAPVWAIPLLEKARYKGAFGGRASGKSHFFAEYVVAKAISDPNLNVLCLREVLRSIKLSVKRLIEQKISKMGVQELFEIREAFIKSRNGDGLMSFYGMQDRTADSIKSAESVDIVWFEEAQNCSRRSLDLLRPTIRKDTAELLFSWNPSKPSDPVDSMFREPPKLPNSVCVNVNYNDNPWFPKKLKEEMEYDKKVDIDKYNWIWLGEYEKLSSAQVFKNWTVEEFETPDDALFRFGADWGFANDPTVLVRLFTKGRKLYIDYEAYEIGCEVDDIPSLFEEVPESDKWPIIADSSRPETISYVKKHGYPKIRKAAKGKDSIKDGVEFIKTYQVIIHPRCPHVRDEFKHYSYKIDKLTEEVLPRFKDAKNNVIDSVRYALEGERRIKKNAQQRVNIIPTVNMWNGI